MRLPWSGARGGSDGHVGTLVLGAPVRASISGRLPTERGELRAELRVLHHQPDRRALPGAAGAGHAQVTVLARPERARFVERVHGESKMSGSIVSESLTLVTWWGLRRRLTAIGLFLRHGRRLRSVRALSHRMLPPVRS